MKSYSSATAISLFISWLTATATYSLCAFATFGPWRDKDIDVTALGSFFFSIVANLIFVQLLHPYFKRLFFRVNNIQFALILSAYGLFIFALLFGWLFRFYNVKTAAIYLDAIINGFVYGLVFHLLWKPELISAD